MTEPTKPPSRTAEQFVVRFPDGMRDLIARAAKTNNRSMNAEIVSRLAESFNPQPTGEPFVAERFEQLKADILQEVIAAIEKRNLVPRKK